MPKQRRSDESQQEILTEQQKRSSLVAGFLQQLALPSIFNRELTESDYELWDKLLVPFPLKGIEYAFDNWGRNGKVFPKPANILELIAAWRLSNSTDSFQPCGECVEGWVYLSEGRTDAGHSIKAPNRMVRRCQCFKDWVSQRKAA